MCIYVMCAPEPPPVESLDWYTHEGELWVEWQPPNMTASLAGLPRAVTEYLVEWVSVSDGQMDWQREGKHTRAAAIRGQDKAALYSHG